MFSNIVYQRTELKKNFFSGFAKDINYFKGKTAEAKTAVILKLFLPHNDILINNVVLEPVKGQIIEIDHVILSKRGIYLIEEKNWHGIYYCDKEKWYLLKGHNQFIPVKSPEKQHERHYKLFTEWLIKNGFSDVVSEVTPILLIHNAMLFDSKNISMTFFKNAFMFLLYFYEPDFWGKKKKIEQNVIDKIAEKIFA